MAEQRGERYGIEPTKSQAATARQEAAGDWADSAREIQDNDLTFVFAAVAQAHAPALLRRSTTVEVLR